MSLFKRSIQLLLPRAPQLFDYVGRGLQFANRSCRRCNVLMFHHGRSGSTALASVLTQYPDVDWSGEPFANRKGKYGKDSQAIIKRRPDLIIRIRTYAKRVPVYGMELKPNHLDFLGLSPSEVYGLVEPIGYTHFILLKRNNYLRRLLSAVTGSKLGYWNSRQKIQNIPSVILSNELFKGSTTIVDSFSKIDNYYDSVKKNYKDKKLLELTYEYDIAKDINIALNKICQFLNIEYVEYIPTTKKLNNNSLRKRISNFDYVCDTLRGTKYEWMLYE